MLKSAAVALMLTGCATIDGCDVFDPIYHSRTDVLGDDLVEQLLTHNTKGREQCGW